MISFEPTQDPAEVTHFLITADLMNILAGYFRKTPLPHEVSDPFIKRLSQAVAMKAVEKEDPPDGESLEDEESNITQIKK